MSIPTQQTAGGAGMGALSGAATGAMAGSAVPVIGNLVGALLGAAIGGLSGGLSSNAAARSQQQAQANRMLGQQGAGPTGLPLPAPQVPTSAVNLGGGEEGQQYSPAQLAAIRGNQMLTQSAGGGGGTEEGMTLADLAALATPKEETGGLLENPSTVGTEGASMADTLGILHPGGEEDLSGIAAAPTSMADTLGGLMKTLGLDNPKGVTSALGTGMQMINQNRALNIARQNAARISGGGIAPGIHGGAAVPVRLGGAPIRRSPLEEFALLLRGR